MPVDQLLSHVPPTSETPLRELSVGDALREAAAVDPAHLALVHAASETRLTYGGLLDESERVARALLARFRPGEHVAVCTPNVPEFLLLQFGAALAGIVLVPVPPALRGRDLAHVLRASRATGIVLTSTFRGVAINDLVAEVRAELSDLREVISLDQWHAFLDAGSDTVLPVVRPEDPSQIQFTSGSTGAPKWSLS